jgi:hypothetical protein
MITVYLRKKNPGTETAPGLERLIFQNVNRKIVWIDL